MSDQTVDLNSLRVPFPRRRNRRLLDFNWSDGRYVLISLAFMGAMSNRFGSTVLTVLVPLVIIGLWRTNYCRLHRWWREELLNLWIRHVRKGVLRDPERARRGGRIFKLSVDSIVAEGMNLGTLFEEEKHEDHIFIVGDGSPFAAMDEEDQYNWLGGLGRAVVNASSEVPFKVGVSTSIIRRPLDMNPHLSYTNRNVKPEIVLAYMDLQEGREPVMQTSQQRVDARRAENLLQLHHATAAFGSETTMVMIISVKRPKWKSGQVTDRQLYRTPIARMARMLQADLETLGVQDPTPLDLSGVSRLVRMFWDVAGLHRFYDALDAGVYPKDDTEIEVDGDGNVTTLLGHWPIGKIVVGTDYIFFENATRLEEEVEGEDDIPEEEREDEAEGTYHRMLMLVGTAGEAMPNEYESIKTIEDGWTALTSVAETMPGSLESAVLTRKISLRRSLTEMKEHNYETPDEEQARVDEETEHQELHRGGNVVQKSNKVLVISATNLDDVQEVQEAFEAVYRSLGLKIQVVEGECRQLRAFVSGMGVSKL